MATKNINDCNRKNKIENKPAVEDGIERVIGYFGRYQILILILVTLGRYPAEFQLTNVVFILPNADYVCLDLEANNATNYCPCQNPEYNRSVIVTSVTTEWNLICDRKSLASLATSVMQIGILMGSLLFGYISDRCGRKLAVLLAIFSEALFGTVSGLVPYFWMFLACRFLIGVAIGGNVLCCYIILIELSGKAFRPYMVGLIELAYVGGYFVLPIIAYFVREWRDLQLVTSAPWLLVASYYWILPESPRWLLTVGKKRAAVEVLKYIAKKNNRPLSESELVEVENGLHVINQQRGTYLDLFKTPKIRKYTIIVACIWLCCSHTFFGLIQYIGRLQGNIYVNVMLTAASLAPGLVLVVVATLFLKRKVSVITSFLIAAVSLFVFIFVPKDMESTMLMLAIIGQLGAYTAFVQAYLYSSEVFPTVIRNSAMGFASVFARVGGFVAPFVVDIGVEWVSILIFSALPLCAAVLCCLLPETKGTVLLNTIEQAEVKSKVKKTAIVL